MHTPDGDESRRTMSFFQRALVVENVVLSLYTDALRTNKERGVIILYPANTTMDERPFMKRLTLAARDGRTLKRRYVFFRPSQTWWTLLLDDTHTNELDGVGGFGTSTQAGVTHRGGDNGDFGRPEVLPEDTSTGTRVATFLAKLAHKSQDTPSSSSSSFSPTPPRGAGWAKVKHQHHHRPEQRRRPPEHRLSGRRHHGQDRHHRSGRRPDRRHHYTVHGAAGVERNHPRGTTKQKWQGWRRKQCPRDPIFTTNLRRRERPRTHSTRRTGQSGPQHRPAQQTTVANTVAKLQRQLHKQQQMIDQMHHQHKRRKRVQRIAEPCAHQAQGCPCSSRLESHGYCCLPCSRGHLCTSDFHPYEEEEVIS